MRASQWWTDKRRGHRRPQTGEARRATRRGGRIGGVVASALVAVGMILYGCTSDGRPRQGQPPEAAPDAAESGDLRGIPNGTAKAVPKATRGPVPTAKVEAAGWHAWAFHHRVTGASGGSRNSAELNFTESMVKSWLAADYLARAAERGREPTMSTLRRLRVMIRDSDDGAAEEIWLRSGGDAAIERMIRTCDLVDTEVFPGWWSKTLMSARDAMQLGRCLADGTAAGATWTSWVLDEMRQVRGEGAFGIIKAIPANVARAVAVKNGWTLRSDDGQWRVNCLGVHEDWVLAVMTRYPGRLGLDHGASICEDVARQVLAPYL